LRNESSWKSAFSISHFSFLILLIAAKESRDLRLIGIDWNGGTNSHLVRTVPNQWEMKNEK